jgi:hypothetical protein
MPYYSLPLFEQKLVIPTSPFVKNVSDSNTGQPLHNATMMSIYSAWVPAYNQMAHCQHILNTKKYMKYVWISISSPCLWEKSLPAQIRHTKLSLFWSPLLQTYTVIHCRLHTRVYCEMHETEACKCLWLLLRRKSVERAIFTRAAKNWKRIKCCIIIY